MNTSHQCPIAWTRAGDHCVECTGWKDVCVCVRACAFVCARVKVLADLTWQPLLQVCLEHIRTCNRLLFVPANLYSQHLSQAPDLLIWSCKGPLHQSSVVPCLLCRMLFRPICVRVIICLHRTTLGLYGSDIGIFRAYANPSTLAWVPDVVRDERRQHREEMLAERPDGSESWVMSHGS